MSTDNQRYPAHAGQMSMPPAVSAAFRWDHEDSRFVLRCLPLARVAQHLFTCVQPALRATGDGVTARANGDVPGSDATARAAAALAIEPGRVMRVHQVHGRTVRVVRADDIATANPNDRPEGDAVVSDAPGLALSVRVADCVPILLAADGRRLAGAVHAGWRGTCAGVTLAAVEAMAREFGTPPEALVAGIGPSIGPEDYEVGDEVRQAFVNAGHASADLDRWFAPGREPGRWWLDLWTANADQLRRAGVPATAIHVAAVSTMAHPGWFESHRRDGARAGRMAALIVVP